MQSDTKIVLVLVAVMFCLLGVVFGEDDPFKSFQWRNLGPGNFSGRIVDIETVDDDYRVVFVASASGGVWKSVNAGTTWSPIFSDYAAASIGDVAIYQRNPNIIWVGTGEANNRNSVSWGNGIYKSTDGGSTFTNMGLEDTFQIAKVVTHPSDPDTVYVAAIGNLWGYTGDRGLFKTVDGGKSWQKLSGGLPSDGRNGATDLVMDPRDPDVLYVAFYQRLRKPYRFDSGGPGGGIFKSVNGGESWTKLTSGLPPGDTGRIGLAVYRENPQILMAIVEHGFRPDPEDPEYKDLSKLGTGIYRSEDGGENWSYINRYNRRPFYYSQIRINPTDDQRFYVMTQEFQFSYDGGTTLEKAGKGFGSSHDYHAMWIDPNNGDRFYVGADKGMFLTHDHGESMIFFEQLPVGQFYAVGVDMRQPYYIYGGTQDNGTWGGPSFSRDARGILTDDFWKLHWGDGMFVQIDPMDWRKVFTEAENGSFRLYDAQTYRVEYRRPSPHNIANYSDFVEDPESEDSKRLPREHFRFNWRSPLLMSSHNPSVLFLAGNHLFMTADQGLTWRIISPDLSTNDPVKTDRESGGLTRDITGAETHCTITALAESPVIPGVVWAGTDDGKLHLSKDFGESWTELTDRIEVPPGLWFSSLEASAHRPDVAYCTIDGHRSDDRSVYVFKTEDYGQTWQRLTSGLPADHPALVIKESSRNPDLVFLGTEFSLYASLDRGASWHRFMNNLPTVSVYDLVIHPRERDLIAGTHGRGIWILDDITPLEQFSEPVSSAPFHLFQPRPQILWEDQSRGGQMGQFYFAGENPPSISPDTSILARAKIRNHVIVHYYLNQPVNGEVRLDFIAQQTRERHSEVVSSERGIHSYKWNLEFDPPEGSKPGEDVKLARPGAYLVRLITPTQVQTRSLMLQKDPM